MTDAARKSIDPALAALERAPQGEPLTDKERARLEEIRARGPVALIPHEAIRAKLEERVRQGE